MPQTKTVTEPNAIASELDMLKILGHRAAVEKLGAVDKLEIEESLFNDPGPDYSTIRAYRAGEQITEFYIPGY